MYQPYLKEVGLPIAYFGIVFAVIAVIGGLGSKYVHKIEKKIGEKYLLIIISLAPATLFLLMAFVNSPWAALLPVLVAVFLGFKDPVISNYVNKHVESHHRATVLSFGLCLFSFGSVIIFPFLGYLSDTIGPVISFSVIALLLALVSFLRP